LPPWAISPRDCLTSYGLKEGRTSKDEIIVCSNIGISVFDMAVAKLIFDRALENGAGRILPL